MRLDLLVHEVGSLTIVIDIPGRIGIPLASKALRRF
jgi:hypothetical protein